MNSVDDKASKLPSSFDAIVIGAGPSGCVAAAALAQRGKTVMVLEGQPSVAQRLAGEWLHPRAVRLLESLGLGHVLQEVGAIANRGFAVFAAPHATPSILDYPSHKLAMGFHHHRFVAALRRALQAMPAVSYREHHRVESIQGQGLNVLDESRRGERWLAVAPLILAADGRRSVGHRAIGVPRAVVPLSAMAGFLIENVSLPQEGYGHVFHHDAHIALAYRISATQVRVLMETPLSWVRSPSLMQNLAAAAYHNLPKSLADAVVAARDGLVWNTNLVVRRRVYGREGLYLLGDAVGVTHPLCASGMMLGIDDAVTAAVADGFRDFRRRRQRESCVPELLSMALYDMLSTASPSAYAMQKAMHELWQRDASFRDLSMSLLGGDCRRIVDFVPPYLHTLALAARKLLAEPGSYWQWRQTPLALAGLLGMVKQPSAFYLAQLSEMAAPSVSDKMIVSSR